MHTYVLRIYVYIYTYVNVYVNHIYKQGRIVHTSVYILYIDTDVLLSICT